MKICMFTNTYTPHVGGVARSVEAFTQDLRDMDHHVLVVAPEFPETEKKQENPAETLRVPAIQNFNGSDFSVRLPIPFQIDNRLDQFEPEVIHSHHPYLLGDAALRAANKRRIPLVFTHHTLYEQYTHYVSEDSFKMKDFAAHLSTEYANLCSRVIAPSQSIARLIENRGVQRPIAEIPTGVDNEFFGGGDRHGFRQRHHISKDAVVIGHLGRLAPEKNLAYLSAAVSTGIQSTPDTCFLVVGEGPSETDMVREFRQKGIDNRLIMAGKQTGRHLADAYHAMDLFVFASKSETQGMVLTEAMACGLPVIAIDAPGAREVVRNNKNGWLLKSDADEETFSETIEHAARNPEILRPMRKAARQTAGAFDRKACAQKLVKLYETALTELENKSNGQKSPEALERLFLAIQAEWDLFSEKTRAALKTINNETVPVDYEK